MDERRFDNLTRRLGQRVSRRDALKAAGAGGAAAAFARVAAIVEAQSTCSLAIHA
ncbi:MAG: twin-arginine translocation signal domain-containing protein, partial [Thermomicrobiales bacterium]|nr:twin-arginine translocation signal domain-containing protein [Thermomicrobiales bacterium]